MSVDDSSAILSLVKAMGRDPGLSRRQAIIDEVGEGGLRRVEMKLKRLEDDGALGAMLRGAIHSDHVRSHPARLVRREGSVTFMSRSPASAGGTDISILLTSAGGYAAVSAHPHKVFLHGLFGEPAGPVPPRRGFAIADRLDGPDDFDEFDAAPDFSVAVALVEEGLMHPFRDATYGPLVDLGLAWPVRGGVIERSVSCPPFVLSLARELAGAWRAQEAACEGMDGPALMAEAVAAEEARIMDSGYAVILSQWGPDMKEAATLLAGDGGREMPYPTEVKLALADPRRAAVLAACGCLVKAFQPEADAPGTQMDDDPWGGFRKALLSERINVVVDDDERMVQQDDVDWLKSVFAGEPLVAIPADVLRAILAHRLFFDAALLGTLEDKIALVQLATIGLRTDGSQGDAFQRTEFFRRLQEMALHQPSYPAIYARILEFSARHGMTLEHAVWFFVIGGSRIELSLFVGAVVPAVVEILVRRGATVDEACRSMKARLSYSVPALAFTVAAAEGSRSPMEVAEAAVAWRDAGRPGQQAGSLLRTYGEDHTRDVVAFSEIPDWRAVYEALRPFIASSGVSSEAFLESAVPLATTLGKYEYDDTPAQPRLRGVRAFVARLSAVFSARAEVSPS